MFRNTGTPLRISMLLLMMYCSCPTTKWIVQTHPDLLHAGHSALTGSTQQRHLPGIHAALLDSSCYFLVLLLLSYLSMQCTIVCRIVTSSSSCHFCAPHNTRFSTYLCAFLSSCFCISHVTAYCTYKYMRAREGRLFTDQGSGRLPKNLNTFSVFWLGLLQIDQDTLWAVIMYACSWMSILLHCSGLNSAGMLLFL